MEREQTYKKYEKVTFAGVRTFALIALVGFLSAILSQEFSDFWMVGVAGFFMFRFIFVL